MMIATGFASAVIGWFSDNWKLIVIVVLCMIFGIVLPIVFMMQLTDNGNSTIKRAKSDQVEIRNQSEQRVETLLDSLGRSASKIESLKNEINQSKKRQNESVKMEEIRVRVATGDTTAILFQLRVIGARFRQ